MTTPDEYGLYRRANQYIDEGLIRVAAPPSGRPRRQWMEWFLSKLGQPQRAFPAIHVAGSAGKGSVATMIAHILRASGVRTGLHVSPYLQVATEKLWIDGTYASARQYADLVEWMRPIAEDVRSEEVPLHGLASVGLCLEHFRREQVAVAVIEVGVGGRNDITNVLQTKVAVITNVGHDHMRTLGPTLKDVAWHKAGIIQPSCRAVVFARSEQDPLVVAAREQAARVGAKLRFVRPGDITVAERMEHATTFSLGGGFTARDGLRVAMAGSFQAYNAALAVAACEELADDVGGITERSIREGLAAARLPGRIETMPVSDDIPCPVVIDGAHNPEKAQALLSTIVDDHRRLHVVYGCLQGKSLEQSLQAVARRCSSITLTAPAVYGKPARPAAELTAELARHTSATIAEQPQPRQALEHAIRQARPGDAVLATGSLYLAGALRERWFPAREVLSARTSWPSQVIQTVHTFCR